MTLLLEPLKYFKDILSSYEDINTKTELFNRLRIIISDNNKGLYGSGITSAFKNKFCNSQLSDINDEWWNYINTLIVNDHTNTVNDLLEESLTELKNKYNYKASYDI